MSTIKVNNLLDTSGNVLSRVLQHVYAHTDAQSQLDPGDTITQLNCTITPSSTSSKILIMATLCCSADGAADLGYDIQRDSTALQKGASASGSPGSVTHAVFANMGSDNIIPGTCIMLDDEISTTNEVTYKIIARPNSGKKLVLNKRHQDQAIKSQSRMIVMEIP